MSNLAQFIFKGKILRASIIVAEIRNVLQIEINESLTVDMYENEEKKINEDT